MAGSASGSGNAIGALGGDGHLTGSASGVATVLGDLVSHGAGDIIGSAEGTSSASGTLEMVGLVGLTVDAVVSADPSIDGALHPEMIAAVVSVALSEAQVEWPSTSAFVANYPAIDSAVA